MKALLFTENKLTLSENVPPPLPAADEALIRVTCAGICATDLEIIKGYMGFEGILGHEFVGIVEECSKKNLVAKRVTGEINIACGKCPCCQKNREKHCPERSVLGILDKNGAFAQYLTLPVKNLHLIPDSVSDEEAVFIEPLAAAFEILEQINISHVDKVCVIGDGRLGNLAAQVVAMTGCKLFVEGKYEEKLAILQERGITTRTIANLHPEKRGDFDIVIDCTGSSSGMERAMKLVRPEGTIVLKSTLAGERTFDFNQLVIDEITLIGSRCGPFEPAIKALENKSADVKPLMSKVFTLENGLEAFDYAAQKGTLKVLLKA
ncbi:MAG: alcohol dehydrogenase catalytic domain-containing protein [Deltaproteobacteria bacterium]|nr:alcohol dehydrogenase catalytic domain-containing protein [Deltaproteobacteria bacterium]